MTGNISTLHSYHRQRVAPEDVKPFGKRVGFGTVICGLACVLFGVMMLIHELTTMILFVWIGTGLLTVGLSIGIIISIKAIMKYNKGLF